MWISHSHWWDCKLLIRVFCNNYFNTTTCIIYIRIKTDRWIFTLQNEFWSNNNGLIFCCQYPMLFHFLIYFGIIPKTAFYILFINRIYLHSNTFLVYIWKTSLNDVITGNFKIKIVWCTHVRIIAFQKILRVIL